MHHPRKSKPSSTGVVLVSDTSRGSSAGGDVIASLFAPRYELFRALGGRCTRTEIAALDWSGDVDQLIGLAGWYPMLALSIAEPAGVIR